METKYGVNELFGFLEMLGDKGLANANTAQALRVAANKILSDLSPEEQADVRKVNVDLAIRRFNNKNPGLLAPNSLAEYERRVDKAIQEFAKYCEAPTAYAGFAGAKDAARSDGTEKKKRSATSPPAGDSPVESRATHSSPQAAAGLSLSFPLRPDFLAQVVLPRDLKSDEAKRLAAFISTLAIDYAP